MGLILGLILGFVGAIALFLFEVISRLTSF
jgi:hypothetical protein